MVSYDLLLFMLKIETLTGRTNSMPFLASGGIICGPHRGSFAVRDHLRFSLRIISGLGIICGRGSFAALYSAHAQMNSTHAHFNISTREIGAKLKRHGSVCLLF